MIRMIAVSGLSLGFWAALCASAAAFGLATNEAGISSRFTAPDRSERIPYRLDATMLPPGITTNQALVAVSNSFAAWQAVTGLLFTNEGLVAFGQGADTITNEDGRIRIQLGDPYSRVPGGFAGIGGRAFGIADAFPNGGMGGKVGTNEFFPSIRGHVVLSHVHSLMTNATTYEEVLCHEIGHVLSLVHSSDAAGETNAYLAEAIMYVDAHDDGRGASLADYDRDVIKQVYPTNTPPYGYARLMDIVTASPQPSVPGINEIEARGYDRQGAALTIAMTNETSVNGSFALTNDCLRYTAAGAFSAVRLDPAGQLAYDSAYLRYSDGSNLSPPSLVRVISYEVDSFPAGASDGLPDSWMTNYFGHADPQAADLSRATDDADGDRLTNLEEFRVGADPTNSVSAMRALGMDRTSLTWQAKAYELYQLQTTTNLNVEFTPVGNPMTPTQSTGRVSFTICPPAGFFRVEKVP